MKRFLVPLLGVILLMSFFPLAVSFKDSFVHDIYGEKTFAGFDNYAYLFSDRGFWLSLGITVIWAVASTAIMIFGGLSAALFLFKKGRFRKLVIFLLFVPWGIPAYMAVPIWRALIHGNSGNSLLKLLTGISVNLITQPGGAFIATLWVSFWMALPFTAFIFVGHLKKIPQDIIDAAKIDGANHRRLLSDVLLPLMKPAVITVTVLNLVKFLKDFTVIFLMTGGGPPMPQLITERSILGATTTAEVFLYDLFETARDIGIPSAFSFIMGLLILTIMLLWYRSQKRAKNTLVPISKIRRLPSKVPNDLVRRGAAFGLNFGSFPLIALVSAGTVLSVYALLWMSFSRVDTTYIDTLFPRFFTTQNFSDLFVKEGILRYYANSLLLSLSCALLIPVLTFGASYAMTRISLKKQTTILTIVNLSTVLSGVHSLIPLFVFFRVFQLTDTYLPLILIYLSHAIPFSLLTLKTYLEHFPPSFYELARMEGMPERSYLWKVLFPLSLSPIATSMIHTFLNAWNGFLAPMIFLNDDAKYPLSVKLYTYVGSVSSGDPKWGLFSAASILNLILVFALFGPLRRPLFQSVLSENAS